MLKVISLVGICLIAMTGSAYAYLDPGTGSVVTTAVLGFFAAVGYSARKYFYRIRDVLTGKQKQEAANRRDS